MLTGLFVILVLLGGCSTVRAFTELDDALSDAGFSSTQVNVAAGDPVTLTVKADAPSGDSTEEAHDEAARVVWESFPLRFEEARITVDGERRTVTSAVLQERFGDRPAGLEEGSLSDEVNRLGIGLVVGVVVAGLLAVVVVGVVVLLVVRRRRRAAQPVPPISTGGPPPWAPPPELTGPGPGPTPPPGGWRPATPGPPGSPGPPGPQEPPSTGSHPVPSPGPEALVPHQATPSPAAVAGPRIRQDRADARRHGRIVRGARPPTSQIPPGWSDAFGPEPGHDH